MCSVDGRDCAVTRLRDHQTAMPTMQQRANSQSDIAFPFLKSIGITGGRNVVDAWIRSGHGYVGQRFSRANSAGPKPRAPLHL